VLSTRCGGQGVTIFYGMAKPVRAPQIGPSRPADEWGARLGRRWWQKRTWWMMSAIGT